MTPFDHLRQHVAQTPDAIAAVTPYRTATYRKMWSRIERSTARLQGEWGIRPGDTIAYLGCGHLDALVMYFAAARCGVRLLPMEHAVLQQQAASLAAAHAVTLVLHDDALIPDSSVAGIPCRPLSTLIATVCKHRDTAVEDSDAVSLIELDRDDVGAAPRLRTMTALAASAAACPAGHDTVRGPLFDTGVFAPVVLATLLAGGTLRLA